MDKIKILIVDDIKENLYSLELLLEDEEMEIVTALSGQKALEKTLDNDFFLILMDVQMPGMNGYETAELLRGNSRTKNIPIIFITANNRDEDQLFKGYDAGAVDFLVKPLATQILKSKINVFRTFHTQQQELLRKTEELNGTISELEELQQELEEKNEQLKILSSRDGLTGLYNRRFFDIFLEEEWSRALRNKNSLAIIMGDIDEFKLFNDNYGHIKGDSCLEDVASIFNKAFHRSIDRVARYGGEEFIALLPQTDLAGAEALAENLLQSVRNEKIPHKGSGRGGFLTLSLGVSCVSPNKNLNAIDFLKCVDKSLYSAKNKGRDKWISEEYSS
ncbi:MULTISPECIES: diguanylate cyclase [unclassified Oceanispirochaeta]|uniref:GGDEF domain-containing response regulator n=1 Tax=unclassified Oceanispirochaeta TaxID=2635722 RepID=UPI000E09AAAC|nr:MULTISPECIES: diguanylate cyclase [unclassified Oceanispirochaeta]MBF9017914.1 diguanylate cyclase [Oceanispirochaeta sp. M2]NPD74425.1 diguanylate cyclase [Oceanispirochaeta sp. M1]RDG29726.1 diguanylate cyclase [Oceanispirochaeta sp. M1]